VIAMDRSLSPGAPAGPISEDVKSALQGAGMSRYVMSVVYGIGGRDLLVDDGKKIFAKAKREPQFGGPPIMYGVKG
jgi:pyruvate/2-oxoacid:ferredoxin oxidoreductase alpha subunit